MREIEIILITPRACEQAKREIMNSLLSFRGLKERRLEPWYFLSNFDLLRKWDVESLSKYFSEDEMEIIRTYRKLLHAFREAEDWSVIRELKDKLLEADFDTLSLIAKKAIYLTLATDCFGNPNYTFLFETEKRKIDEYFSRLSKIKYESFRRGVRKYIRRIDDKIEDITEILWR